MHNEEAVIDHVCEFLKASRFTVASRRGVRNKGKDIEGLAPDGQQRFAIEAKGATATKNESAGFGRPFARGSVYSSVTTAYFCASTYGPKGFMAGMALPDNEAYRKQLSELLPSLEKLDIEVFWVQPDGQVTVEGNWALWRANVT
jgi:hypothetical protein